MRTGFTTIRNCCLLLIALVLLPLVVGALGGRVASAALLEQPPARQVPQADVDRLASKARERGSLRVVVDLNVEADGPGLAAPQARRDAIARQQERLLARLAGFKVGAVKKFSSLPVLALDVDEAALRKLAAFDETASLAEDKLNRVDLAESTSLIGAPAAWAAGYSGAGMTVAIIDTGVDSSHPFLAGKVVAEACFSTTGSSSGYSSTNLCPGGADSTATGSAQPCPGYEGCPHGTHVAGIAAGKGATFSGVAKDATIIAVQVFSLFDAATCGGVACIAAWDSDIRAGLHWVYEQRSLFNIAAVNMSLGGGMYGTNCDAVGENAGHKLEIDALRAANIATVVASGNEGYTNALASPACISSAVSVGSTQDGSSSTTADAVSYFSNSASFLSLLAPGQWIRSSVPGGGYDSYQGTSMAAPHVAGAWAVLRSKFPDATVGQILAALSSSGLQVRDSRNGITKPRIRLDVALGVITPSLTIDDITIAELTGSTPGVASFTVRLSEAAAHTVSVAFVTGNETALAGKDFTTKSGTVTFAPGTTTQTISVNVTSDNADEVDETFAVKLSGVSGAVLDDAVGQATIVDDDLPPTISIADLTTIEANAGTVTLNVPVRLSAASGKVITVAYATRDGSALAGQDYVGKSGTLTFAAGTTALNIPLSIAGDVLDEIDETLLLDLSAPTEASLSDAEATITIRDNDGPTISVDDVSVTEGDSGQVNARFTVSLSAPSVQPVSVRYQTIGSSATAAKDFISKVATLTFEPGVTSQTVDVAVLGDLTSEYDETFTLKLDLPVNATVADASGLGTILENGDPDPSVTIGDVRSLEGSTSPGGSMLFPVKLSVASGKPISVTLSTSAGSALAGVDFTERTTTLVFSPGMISLTFAVPLNSDAVDEANETFDVTLSSPVHVAIADGSALATIDDDDGPIITVEGGSLTEGDAGTSDLTFNVRLSAASPEVVTVRYATINGTAVAGADYQSRSGTLTFNPGITELPVVVPVVGELLDELDETFLVRLSTPTEATVVQTDATGGIISDVEPLPALSVADISILEGDSSTALVRLTARLSTASGKTVKVAYRTSNNANSGSATSHEDVAGNSVPFDFYAERETLTFNPGTTSLIFDISINNDLLDEVDEIFDVLLAEVVNATVADGSARVTIDDNDGPTISINDASADETDAGTVGMTFTVRLSAPSPQAVTVKYQALNGTALAGSDFTSASGTLTFAPGVLAQKVVVGIKGDLIDEQSETINLQLSLPTEATLLDGTGLGTIVEDQDPAPTISIVDLSLTEGNGGVVTPGSVTVQLSGSSGKIVTVGYVTVDETAQGGDGSGIDYRYKSGTLTFAPGTTSARIDLSIVGDGIDEVNETFLVSLRNAGNATIRDNQGLVTIRDDDGPRISINSASGTEADLENILVTFVVTLSAPSVQQVKVNFATVGGTALAGTDFGNKSGTLTFLPGDSTQTFTVSIKPDQLKEVAETFQVRLSGAVNGTIDMATGTGTIFDDD